MAEFKVTINDPKSGKSYKKDINDESSALLGKSIGDKIKGEPLGMAGYEFEVTGGSDSCGFPMRTDVGTARKKILAVEGTGLKPKNDGQRQRKTLCGAKIVESISQVNLKVIKYGKEKLDAAKEEAPAVEAAPEQKPEEKPKEEAPKEDQQEKPEEPKEEENAKEVKEEKEEEAKQ